MQFNVVHITGLIVFNFVQRQCLYTIKCFACEVSQFLTNILISDAKFSKTDNVHI